MLNGNVTLATYKIDGVTYVPSSGGVLDCSPSEVMTSAFTLSAGGINTPVPAIGFITCQ